VSEARAGGYIPIVAHRVIAGKYRIEGVLGRGAMAVVHAAHHELLDQPVALKMLYPEVARIPEATTRFLHEGKIAARIKSPNVCRILDVGVADDGAPYIAMERLSGMNLDEVIDLRRTFAIAEAVDLVTQAILGVEAAHAIGVVHRDLKPANLVVCEGANGPNVKVVDFGVSKSSALSDVTLVGAMLGSPTHMSPEQIRDSRGVDARADIWALGVILYELLAGALPFGGVTTADVLQRILQERPASLRTLRPEVPAALDEVVLKCLSFAREDRYPTARDLREALVPFGSRPLRSIARPRSIAPLRSIAPWSQSQPPEPAVVLSSTAAGFRQALFACAVVVFVGTAAMLTLALHLSSESERALSASGVATSMPIDRNADLAPTSALVPLADAGADTAAQKAAKASSGPRGRAQRGRRECPNAFICAPIY
jgi:serine/threonine-protein kinase